MKRNKSYPFAMATQNAAPTTAVAPLEPVVDPYPALVDAHDCIAPLYIPLLTKKSCKSVSGLLWFFSTSSKRERLLQQTKHFCNSLFALKVFMYWKSIS